MKVLVTKIKGIHYGSCILTIERVSKDQGAIKVDIDLKTSVAKFYYEDMDEERTLSNIEQRGYSVEKLTTFEEENL